MLQKRFTRWAGISPKDFLALLNAKRARQLLQKGSSILEASLETGLSSPSRLHDLFVRIEAMTPGDYKRQGEHLTLLQLPFGMSSSARHTCRRKGVASRCNESCSGAAKLFLLLGSGKIFSA